MEPISGYSFGLAFELAQMPVSNCLQYLKHSGTLFKKSVKTLKHNSKSLTPFRNTLEKKYLGVGFASALSELLDCFSLSAGGAAAPPCALAVMESARALTVTSSVSRHRKRRYFWLLMRGL